jgi:hypothetical protein
MMGSPPPSDRIRLELSGSEAVRGLPLFNLETFIDQMLRGLRAFDRVSRLEPARKAGHPEKRAELVTAFRLIGFRTGSAILELEPDVDVSAEPEIVPDASTLAVDNFRALLDAIESTEPVDPDVADALAGARRALGHDGRIEIVHAKGRRKRRVTVDGQKIENLRARARRQPSRPQRISGRLHLIDVDPPLKVAIRTPDGTDWTCRYSVELEPKVRALLGQTVTARGVGSLTGAKRGTLDLEEIEAVARFEQTELFTFERVPLEDLMNEQGTGESRGAVSVVPEDLDEEELERFLEAILED